MNLFRSEEHVKNWSLYDPGSEDAIMPLADWAQVQRSPLMRNRLEPDMLARTEEYFAEYLGRLAELGKTGAFWTPG